MFRTSGACGDDELFLVSGMSPNISALPRGLVDAARLTTVAGSDAAGTAPPRWDWTLLPKVPEEGSRWLGAAGVVNGYLVIAAGANACGFEAEHGVPIFSILYRPCYRSFSNSLLCRCDLSIPSITATVLTI